MQLYRSCTAQAWAGAQMEAPSTLATPMGLSGFGRSLGMATPARCWKATWRSRQSYLAKHCNVVKFLKSWAISSVWYFLVTQLSKLSFVNELIGTMKNLFCTMVLFCFCFILYYICFSHATNWCLLLGWCAVLLRCYVSSNATVGKKISMHASVQHGWPCPP